MVFSSGWFQPENMHDISKREKITRSKKKGSKWKKKLLLLYTMYAKIETEKIKQKKGDKNQH